VNRNDSKFGMVSAIAGVLVAAGVFVVLALKWTPPRFILDELGAPPARTPAPQNPRYKLAVRPDPPTDAGAIVTEADVSAARPQGAEKRVELTLTADGVARLAEYAKGHANETLAIAVDEHVVATKRASEIGGVVALYIPVGEPLADNETTIAARFGGAPQAPPLWILVAAWLAPALVAGFIALALVRILTRR
jgi:hypothetical protein